MPESLPHKKHSETPLALRLIVVWVAVAALAQLLFLAYWPLHVLGLPIARLPALGVALVRLGIYSGLWWGLVRGQRVAWAATVLELARSLIFFMVPFVFGERALMAAAYPTVWAQGLLTAGLPLILPFDVALAMGWRPPFQLELALALPLRLWGATAAVAALWLRRHASGFEVPPEHRWLTLLKDGLPVVLLLSAVESGALFWSLVLQRI